MAKDKTDIWMPVYIGDYLSDTMHLTVEQHGAYFLLLMAYWKNRGALLESRLKTIVNINEDSWTVLEEFFDTTSCPGKWKHNRIEKELELSARIKEVRSEAGKTGGGNPNFQKGKQNPYYTDKQKDKQTDKQTNKQKINPSPSPSPSPLKIKNKDIYLDCVSLSKDEYQKLIDKEGEFIVTRAIEILNNYKMSSGKKYKSDYHTMLNWVLERVKDEQPMEKTRKREYDNTICPFCPEGHKTEPDMPCSECMKQYTEKGYVYDSKERSFRKIKEEI